MSCYHPLKAIDYGRNVTGKHSIKVLKGEYDPYEHSPVSGTKFIPIPCGKCIGCRLDYSRQWADRCFLESKYHKDNYFVTLTFDDDHLPPKFDGSEIHSIRKSDLQKFLKDLRSKVFDRYVSSNQYAVQFYEKKKGSRWRSEFQSTFPNEYKTFVDNTPVIRFFGCGEYGKSVITADSVKYGRPHYHVLLFGLELDDLKMIKFDCKRGYAYYTSEFIGSIWRNGYHIIGNLTWDTCAYTARYVVKKLKGQDASKYQILNYEPEFVLMSRRPGIGSQYFKDHPDIVKSPVYVSTLSGSKRISSNRYFDKLYGDIDYDELENIKLDRSFKALDVLALKMDHTSNSYKDMLEVEERNKQESIKSLTRKEV